MDVGLGLFLEIYDFARVREIESFIVQGDSFFRVNVFALCVYTV
jgi:hypothetical protein